jgi:hypothetical protein
VRGKLPKVYSRELVDAVFEQPYCRIANLVEANIVGRQAASRYLKVLASIGAVLLGELIEQLRETLAERQQVLATIRTGRRGPFEFERTVWKVVDLFAGSDPSGPA